jgi:uncharacterized protein YecT (DUF1311 family)
MLKMIFLSIMILAFTIYAQKGENGSTCNFSKTDSLLNQVYGQVIKEYKQDTLFIIKLKEAQRAWIKFRDAYLESRFPIMPKSNQYNEYGSIYPYCACVIMTDLTKERIKQLQAWLNGTVEGDVCGGSYKTKN